MQTMLFLILAIVGLVVAVGCCVFSTKDGSHCPSSSTEKEDKDPITRSPPSPIISRGDFLRYVNYFTDIILNPEYQLDKLRIPIACNQYYR